MRFGVAVLLLSLLASPAGARTVTVTAGGPYRADGFDPATVNVLVTDDAGMPVDGLLVHLVVAPPTFVHQLSHDVRHLVAHPAGPGRYTATFSSRTVGSLLVVAYTADDAANGTAMAEFEAAGATPAPGPTPIRAPARLQSFPLADAKADCEKFFDKLDDEFYDPILVKKIMDAMEPEKTRLKERRADLGKVMRLVEIEILLEELQARGMAIPPALQMAFDKALMDAKASFERISKDLRKVIEDGFAPFDVDKFQACTELFNNFKLVPKFEDAIDRIKKAKMGMMPPGDKIVPRGPDSAIAHIRWAKFAKLCIGLGADADFWRKVLPTLAKGTAITADVLMDPPQMLKDADIKKHRDMFDPLRPKADDNDAKKKEKLDMLEKKLIELVKKINVDKKVIGFLPGTPGKGGIYVAVANPVCPQSGAPVRSSVSGPITIARVEDSLMGYGVDADGRSWAAAGTVVGSQVKMVIGGRGLSPSPDGSVMVFTGFLGGDGTMVNGTLEGAALTEVDTAGLNPCTWDGSFQAQLYNPVPAACGNGISEQGESCDDGNTNPNDGCSATCMMEPSSPPSPVCGNRLVESGEACDDGNLFAGDGCSPSCQIETAPPVSRCGNGVLEAGEQCDDGNFNDVDGCTSGCLRVFTTRPIAGQSR